MEKKWVNARVYDIKLHKGEDSGMGKVVSGKIVDIISNFTRALVEAEELGYKNLRIRWGHHADGISCYDLEADKLETDEQFERRKKYEEEKEAKERALYEELKTKFD
jgi:hypothetical protein